MPTYGRFQVALEKGKGAAAYDCAGKKYIDFGSGIGVNSLGYCDDGWVKAVTEQAAKLQHISNLYYNPVQTELAEKLCRASGYSKVFFGNSGAEANECAIKLARLHARKRAEAQARAAGAGEDEARAAASAAPRVIVTLDRSFHGRTMATLAATAQPAKQEAFQPLPDGFAHTAPNDVAALEALFAERGHEICAVMVECVQGEGGVHPCTPEFLQAARRLTEERGTLLMCDEVQTGVFRCGTPFAFQRFGIVPDVVTIAKGVASGMPAGMCAARADVAASFAPGDHGSTFGGSNLAVVAAQATLCTLADEGFGERVERVGAYLRVRLAELTHVVEVRGLGLMVAADLADDVDANDVVLRALGEGLVINATGPHTLRFLPPLVCEEQHVDQLVERLSRLLGA